MTHITDRSVETPVAADRSDVRRRALIGLLALAVLCGGGAVWYQLTRPAASLLTSAGSESPDIVVVIPAGTAENIAAGDAPDLIPNPLIVHVGDVISIENQDDSPVLLGPFAVGAGQTLVQRFRAAGTLEGACNVHPTGRLRIIVEA